ncbi:MAG: MFS transporter [Bacteroidota bacterium]
MTQAIDPSPIPPQPPELWRRNLRILWGTQFLAMIGMNLVVPFLPFYIRSLGVTDPDDLARWSGLVFAGPFFVSFVATPFWGNLGDRYGRKIMVVRALFGLAVSQVLMGLAQDVYQLLLFRIVQGAISGFIASALALVSTNTPKERIGYALGVMQSATAGGMVLGPFIGGLLADLIGYREIFFVTAVICAAGGVVVIRRVVELTRGPGEGKRYTVRENYRLMYRDRRLRVIALTLVVSQMSVLMIEPIFALYIEGFAPPTSQFVSTLAGGIFSITGLFMVISAPWWGKRNDRRGYRKHLTIALSVGGVAYMGHIIVPDLLQLALLRAFLGFARGGVLPALYSLTSVYAPPERRGGMMAIASSMTILGNMLGPVLGGAAAGAFGIKASFVVTGLLLIATSWVVWRNVDDGRVPAPAPGAQVEQGI